jgi:hypothetical protein
MRPAGGSGGGGESDGFIGARLACGLNDGYRRRCGLCRRRPILCFHLEMIDRESGYRLVDASVDIPAQKRARRD